MTQLVYAGGILIFMAASAFFSGVEMAFVSVNQLRLKHLSGLGNPKAERVRELQEEKEEVLTALLLGHNLSVVGAVCLFTLMVYPLGEVEAEWLSTLIMTPLVLIFVDIIPKVIFRHEANQLIFTLVDPLNIYFKISRRVAGSLLFLVRRLIFSVVPRGASVKSPYVGKEELRHLIQDGQAEGLLEPHERRIIERIFEFGAITVKEVMTRKAHITSIDEGATIAKAREVFKRSGFSRLPVRSQDGRFIGILHILDCLFEGLDAPMAPHVRELVLIKTDTVVEKALIELRVRRQRMAIVTSSSGDALGLVTVQDLITL